MKTLRLIAIALLCCFAAIQQQAMAKHAMHPQAQIDFVKKQIRAKNEPVYTAYQDLLKRADALLGAEQHAMDNFVVPGYYQHPAEHRASSKALAEDGSAAYTLALAYMLSGNEAYGRKALYLLNAWAATNKGYGTEDSPLVMGYAGTGLMIAAELMQDSKLWSVKDKAVFTGWVVNVLQKAANQIRVRTNNWGDWGRFCSLLAAAYLEDWEEVGHNVYLIKRDLPYKISADGHMPEETRRGDNGLWYTYFSLAPMTASFWLVNNLTGENLFAWQGEDGASVKKAIDYLLYYQQHPDEWPWADKVSVLTGNEVHRLWPDNLLESMYGVYGDEAYQDYVKATRPHTYTSHHLAWVYPTLMPLQLYDYDTAEVRSWANYECYAAANDTVTQAPVAAFMGNSITENWMRMHREFFTENRYAPRGISGQVTAQMLARFRADVVDLHPQVVVILGGTNDFARNQNYISIEHVMDNIASMAEIAKANGIKVILCSVLPAYAYPWRPTINNPAGKVMALNKLMKEYADSHGCIYLDFHSLMHDARNGLPADLAPDGIHPSMEGYAMMERMVKAEIDKLINQ